MNSTTTPRKRIPWTHQDIGDLVSIYHKAGIAAVERDYAIPGAPHTPRAAKDKLVELGLIDKEPKRVLDDDYAMRIDGWVRSLHAIPDDAQRLLAARHIMRAIRESGILPKRKTTRGQPGG